MASTGTNLSRTLSSPTTLEVLDPSPDETPTAAQPSEKGTAAGYFPAQSTAAHTTAHSSNSNSNSNSTTNKAPGISTPHLLAAIQRYSSYTFTVFAAVHLTNTSLIPLALRSAHEADAYLLLTRPYYQSWPLAEPLLVLAPLAAHIASGLALRARRAAVLRAHYGDSKTTPTPRLSATAASGYASALLVAGHAALNRALPAYAADDAAAGVGLAYVAHGVARHPLAGVCGFGALVAVVAGHVVWGWSKWLGLAPGPVPGPGARTELVLARKRRVWAVWAVVGAVVGVWAAGGVGVVAVAGRTGGWAGDAYDRIYAGLPVLGRFW